LKPGCGTEGCCCPAAVRVIANDDEDDDDDDDDDDNDNDNDTYFQLMTLSLLIEKRGLHEFSE